MVNTARSDARGIFFIKILQIIWLLCNTLYFCVKYMLEIYPPATKVLITIFGFEGYIISASIFSETHVNYNVAYHLNGEYKTITLYDWEFETQSEKSKIGFIKQ